eukprot:3796090-Amphidinium_carterae.1
MDWVVQPTFKFMQRMVKDGMPRQYHSEGLIPQSCGDSKLSIQDGSAPAGDTARGSPSGIGGHGSPTGGSEDDIQTQMGRNIPHQEMTIEKLPVKILRFVLEYCEPVVCSPQSLRAMCVRGARETSKRDLT